MMMRVAVLADELSATGWHLAGADVRITALEHAEAVFEAARQDTQLLLITAPVAAGLDADVLARALRGIEPLVLVIGDATQSQARPDLEHEVRRALGVEA